MAHRLEAKLDWPSDPSIPTPSAKHPSLLLLVTIPSNHNSSSSPAPPPQHNSVGCPLLGPDYPPAIPFLIATSAISEADLQPIHHLSGRSDNASIVVGAAPHLQATASPSESQAAQNLCSMTSSQSPSALAHQFLIPSSSIEQFRAAKPSHAPDPDLASIAPIGAQRRCRPIGASPPGCRDPMVRFTEETQLPVAQKSAGSDKILLKSPWEILEAPTGSGGIFASLASHKGVEFLQEMGVEYVQFPNIFPIFQPVAVHLMQPP
ncbi:hypothetical protein KSP40_PGU005780 [Platanthera guangdongensis]|uniref:Uncharacterized protein n=1 Tax=Platanthera guangdongensis TaxID=2320717 RepID=A0ABR2LP10_9ASPA